MSLILSIETGTDICSVALSQDGELLSLRESEEGRDHAQKLATYIEEVFEQNNIDADELSAIAIGMGPGSYTGLRIGTSVAKGLCYGASKPLIAVSSLQSLACVALDDYEAGLIDCDNIEDAILCPMIDARRMEVYASLFDYNATQLNEVAAYIIDENSFADIYPNRTMIFFGNGSSKTADIIKRPGSIFCHVSPSARGMVRIANEKFIKGQTEDVAYFEPFYLKDFVAGLPKRNPLQKTK